MQTGTQGSFVYVVRDGNPPPELEQAHAATRAGGGKGRGNAPASGGAPHYVVVQPIRVDLTEGTQTVVAEGLKPGDQVVIDGTEKLRNGSRVLPRVVQNVNTGANPIATGNPPPASGPASNTHQPRKHTHASESPLDEPSRHPRRPDAPTDPSSPGTGTHTGQGTQP